MEGMPRFPMFAPDFKLGCNTLEENGFEDKIYNYIRSHYGQNPDEFVEDMQEFNKLRNNILLPFPSDELIPHMKRYYAQLLLLSNQFPLDGKHPDLTCEWQWSDRLHDPNNVLIIRDVHFELCNMMYNLAAIHAQIGSEIPRDEDEGIKKAFLHFGFAAYPLQVLRDEMNASRFPTLDFDKDTVSLYLNIIMGQAQECMVEKALVESRKPLVIARLTSHLHDIYDKCATHLAGGPLADVMNASRFREWHRMCTIKSTTYGAISMLYQGLEAEENKKYGERVAYYHTALSYITTARNHCAKETRRPYLETVAFVDDVITFKFQDAKKENDFIYHAKIPKVDEISMAEPLNMACAYSFNPLDPEIAGPPLFAGLMPPSVVKALSEYDERKAALKRSIMEKVEAYDIELQQFIDRLDLTRMVKMIKNPYGTRTETESPSFSFPEDLLAANSYFSIQNRDAVPEVLEQLRVIGEKARVTDSLLAELVVRLDTLNSSNLPNSESAEGVRAIKDECVKLLEASSTAKGKNMKLRLALDEKMEAIQTLGMSLEELVKTLAPKEIKDYATTKEGARMILLGEKVEEMLKQRKFLLNKMHEEFQADNINGKVLIEKDTNHAELFEKELKKHDNLLHMLEQNLNAQEKIKNALLEGNADFAESGRELREQAEQRNMRILDLISSSDEYFRVIAELEHGTAFYGRLEERARKIEQAVETIESTFSDFFKKRNEKMAAAERKMAEERAVMDAQAALEDFSMPVFPSALTGPLAAPSPIQERTPPRRVGAAPEGGRRRLGDYMQYYRDKMAGGGGGGVLPSPSTPPSLPHLQYTHHPVQPGPPLPPLSIPSLPSHPPPPPSSHHPHPHYADSNGAPSPAPSTVSNLSYAPPPSAAPAAAPLPHHHSPSIPHQPQGFPRYAPPPPQQHQPYGSYPMQQPGYAPPPPAVPTSHAPYMPPQHQQGFPPAAASLSSHQYAPPPQLQQPQQQPAAPPMQHYNPQPQQQPIYTPAAAPIQAPPSTVPQPTVHAPPPPPPAPAASTTVPLHPPHQPYIPPTSHYISPPLPPTSSSSSFSQFPPPSASPFAAPSPWLQGSAAAARQLQFAAASPQMGQQQLQQPGQMPQSLQQPQQPMQQPAASPSKPTQPAAPPATAAAAKLPSLADLGAQLKAAAAVPLQPMQQPAAAPSIGGGPSPWHRGMTAGGGVYGMPQQPQAPWMQQQQPMQQGSFGAPAAVAPPTLQQQPPAMQQRQPISQQPMQQAPQRNETIDLLSDLFSSASVGPAAIQPTGVAAANQAPPAPLPVQQQQLQQHPAAAPLAAVASVSVEQQSGAAAAASSTAVVRPAAAVMPMQQMNVQQGGGGGAAMGDDQILSISAATSVGYAPVVNGSNGKASPSASLTTLLDASTFSIGEGDAARLAKKQLHAANRGVGAPPTLDPADPLNGLDPFWKTK